MSRKEEYKLQNEQFLEQLRTAEGIKELPCGILYRVLEEGRDGLTPRLNSVVSVHYKGTLINGREFDNSWKRNCPEAFRLNEVIEGWQIALLRMHPGITTIRQVVDKKAACLSSFSWVSTIYYLANFDRICAKSR